MQEATKPTTQESAPALMTLGRRKAGNKRTPDAYRSQVWEATPDGAAKMAVIPWRPEQVYGGTLTTSAATLWTAQSHWAWLKIIVCNNSAAARTFELHHVLSGGSASTSNLIWPVTTNLEIGQRRWMYVPGMRKGDFISGLCSSNNTVSVTIYGIPA